MPTKYEDMKTLIYKNNLSSCICNVLTITDKSHLYKNSVDQIHWWCHEVRRTNQSSKLFINIKSTCTWQEFRSLMQ